MRHLLPVLWTALLFLTPNLAPAAPGPGACPQPRFTGKAPDDYYKRVNPLQPTAASIRAGERLYAEKNSCAMCHGSKGDGKGPLASQFDPPPRNFACAKTITGIPDGQLFWIVRFGSPGTSMPEHPEYSDDQIWQIILHLRRLAR
jgi:mono/diheme cytochrome c family protein